MDDKEVIKCTKDQLERMLKLAHCDGKHGFPLDFKNYLVVLE